MKKQNSTLQSNASTSALQHHCSLCLAIISTVVKKWFFCQCMHCGIFNFTSTFICWTSSIWNLISVRVELNCVFTRIITVWLNRFDSHVVQPYGDLIPFTTQPMIQSWHRTSPEGLSQAKICFVNALIIWFCVLGTSVCLAGLDC